MENNDCQPDAYEIVRIFAGKLCLNTPSSKWEDEIWPAVVKHNVQRKLLFDEIKLREIYESTVVYVNNQKKSEADKIVGLKETLQKDIKTGVHVIADHLIQKYNIKVSGNRDNTKEIHLYSNGVYKIDYGYGLLKKEILDITQSLVTSHTREEIVKNIKEKSYIEKNHFSVDKNFINLKNGVYDLKSKSFTSHNPSQLFLYQIPVNYIPEANCLKIKEFLNQILDYESIDIIQEWLGYFLYRSYFIKRAIIFLGDRDTGKTTLLKVFANFLGKENVSGVSLQRLSSDKFALSNLFNKHANIYDDLSFKDIQDNGIFKMVTGGGDITGEKKFGDLFTFANYAKLTFSCNKIPNIKDTDDEAYFNRWILIRFEHRTTKPDKFLLEKMNTDDEMSGLLNFALEGLFRLLENQEFSFNQAPEDTKKEMCMSGSSLAQFIYDELAPSSNTTDYITKDNMLQAFINYASKNNLPTVTKERLGKNLHKYIAVSDGRKSIWNNKTEKIEQVNCWIGIKFINSSVNSIGRPLTPDEQKLQDAFDELESG